MGEDVRQISARTRLIIFFVGFPVIAFGTFGLARGAAWANVAGAVFTFFGTMMSFAQFSLGFASLKPDKDVLPPTPIPRSPIPQIPPSWSIYAWLTSPTGQINLGSAHFGIGRMTDNQWVLNDSQVSDHHALIFPDGRDYALLDLGSTNGTWVNGQRLVAEMPQTLRPGDTIRMGNTFFTYQMRAVPATSQPFGTAEQQTQPPRPQPPISLPAQTRQKQYIGSGIAFLITGVCVLIYTLFVWFVPNSTTLFSTNHIISLSIFGLAWVSGLCGIQGFYLKQAHRAGWPGVVGTIMVAAGWLINIALVLVIIFLYASIHLGKLTRPDVAQWTSIFTIFYNVNFFFIVVGDIILGIGVVQATIYPSWTGFALSIAGCLALVFFLGLLAGVGTNPGVLVIAKVLDPLLISVVFFQWGVTLIQSSHSLEQRRGKQTEAEQ